MRVQEESSDRNMEGENIETTAIWNLTHLLDELETQCKGHFLEIYEVTGAKTPSKGRYGV